MTPRLTTARLILHPLTETHFETFYQTLVLDPETMRFWHAYHAGLTDEARRVVEKLGFRFRGRVAAYGSEDMVHYTLKRADVTALFAKDPHHALS